MVGLLVLAGCVSPQFTAPRERTQANMREPDMRRALDRERQAEANKSAKAELRLQLSQSKTNYPPYAKEKGIGIPLHGTTR